jgi:hypothetical protein
MKYLNLKILTTGQILANTKMTVCPPTVTEEALNTTSVGKVKLGLMYID